MGCETGVVGALVSGGSRPGADAFGSLTCVVTFEGAWPSGNNVYAARSCGAEVSGLKYPPGPTAITTNCFCVCFPQYVMGVACPLVSSWVTQSSLPVFESNARKR